VKKVGIRKRSEENGIKLERNKERNGRKVCK
jgi:hypothetical protein